MNSFLITKWTGLYNFYILLYLLTYDSESLSLGSKLTLNDKQACNLRECWPPFSLALNNNEIMFSL